MKKRLRIGLCALMLFSAFGLTAAAALYDWPPSGKEISTQSVTLPGVKGQQVPFACTDLEFRMNLAAGSLQEITVTQVPKETEGTLTVNGNPVKAYDTLTRDEINQMVYTPNEGAVSASLTFVPKADEAATTTVSIALADQENTAPIIESGSFDTVEDVPIKGVLSVYDAEGDQIRIQVVNAPKKGEVSFEGASFTYTPFLGSTGKDRFSFVCVDKAGNYSKEGLCDLTIEAAGTKFSYRDMTNNPSQYSAIKLREKGVLTGEKIGDASLFYPKRTVTRQELLMMILSACGAGEPDACVNTGLTNDSAIPLWLKPYVKQAVDRKIITEDKFVPDEVPTRAEAVVLIDRAAEMDDVKKQALRLSDTAAIPNWALQSYLNLSAYKMLDLYDGAAHPTSALTRDTAADLVWQLWKYHDQNETIK